ncbi:MAG: MFS transporter [Frankiaceae bacterium]
MTHARSGPTRAQRLDELPITPAHGRLVLGAGLGWALDAMDVGLISFVMAALAVQWKLSSTTLSWIASLGFVGMALGASLGGLLADRVGRRQVFAGTLLVYGLATGAAALSWSVGALLAFRFVIGLGLGAELPVASTLVSEYAPARLRGRMVVALEAFWAVGWLLAALIGYFVVADHRNGWRWAFALGALPAVYAVVVRRALPESVRFLEQHGRDAEAEAAVRQFEQSARMPAPALAPADGPAARVVLPEPAGVATLWSPTLRRRTAALWLVWFAVNFAYYGAFIWLPTLLYASGLDLVKSFGFTLIITLAQLPGYAAAAVLVEVWGRRATLSVFLAGSAAAAIFFGNASGTASVLMWGMALSFFNLGAWGALYAVTPEMYPTAIRATGAGWAAGFGRIASILAPFAVPPLRSAGGTGLVFAVFGACFLLAAAAAWAVPEQRGRSLPESPVLLTVPGAVPA